MMYHIGGGVWVLKGTQLYLIQNLHQLGAIQQNGPYDHPANVVFIYHSECIIGSFVGLLKYMYVCM